MHKCKEITILRQITYIYVAYIVLYYIFCDSLCKFDYFGLSVS